MNRKEITRELLQNEKNLVVIEKETSLKNNTLIKR
jgi:hypothetical protein|nr:MAG TPA: hypothetical protein [Caudoviricetes sp.]